MKHNIPNRSQSPATAALSVPTLLSHTTETLSNGIEIVYVHDPQQEVFKLDILFEAGVLYQSQPLIASTAVNMLNEGTLHHTAEEIADLFDYYGAYIDFNCGLNKMEISLISLNKYAGETIGMLAEMIAESSVPEIELEIFLRNKRQEFLVNNEKTSYLTRKEFSRLLFGENHPYANSISEKDYAKVTAPLVREFYHQYINAHSCRIMASGNAGPDIRKEILRHFSQLDSPAGFPSTPNPDLIPAPAGRYHICKKNAVQASLRIGKTGVQITHDDYTRFMLLNTVLGGYFGSRLMSNIREEKGYTYGIQSFNVSLPESAYWCVTADINSQYTEAVVEEVLKEIRTLQNEAIPEDELTLVKNYLHGDLLRELDGVFSQADALKHKLNYGLDNSIYTQMIKELRQCSAGELTELARKYWKEEDFYIVTADDKK